jgi:hypothetical protein
MKTLVKILVDALILWAVCFGIILGMAALTPSVGQSGEVYRCGAMTTKNEPCKMRVKSIGAKCHHHAESGTVNATAGKNAGTAVIHTCGAQTAKGLPCKRRVKIAGAKCYSHQ